jgi:aminopeptidase YwaD
MKKLFIPSLFLFLVTSIPAQQPPLLPEPTVSAIAHELSGETAKRNLEFLARLHRQRGSRGFHAAAEFVAAQARAYGLADVNILQFPADGRIFYGTQRSRPPWDAESGDLWELRESGGRWVDAERLASWDAAPITLAEDSESAEVSPELVDVGAGTAESDYAGKEVRGKIVLASERPGAVERLAVQRLGAVGIVSYAQNQRTAWWGEDDNLIRWGHLDTFPSTPAFAFMISLKRARELRDRLAHGESIRLHASVRAGRHPGAYEVVTAAIPGADERLRGQEIVFSCHLDHQRPGANDNASGCVTILEVARTLSKLIAESKIPRPARTIRFIWPPEIEGTMALLNSKPELAQRIQAVVHMDMVGGGRVTKAVFHITRGPASLPSFINDVAEAFGDFVNRQSHEFASTGKAAYPLVAPEGGKEALQADFSNFTPGSDHEIYEEGSFRIPAIYFNDWPDRYIHTNFDAAANIDPTKLLRAGFLGATSGYFLASLSPADVPAILRTVMAATLRRTAAALRRSEELKSAGTKNDAGAEAANLARFELQYERAILDSIERFAPLSPDARAQSETLLGHLRALLGSPPGPPPATGDGKLVFARNPEPKGPMSVFGYDYLAAHYGEDRARALRLERFSGPGSSAESAAYEILNFVDGRRNAQEIRDAISAEFAPLPADVVVEYLRALETIGVLRRLP